MTDMAATGAYPARPAAGDATARAGPDARRVLQLGLAGLWLLDGVLQYQAFMFSRRFSDMLAESAAGNPGVVARPITWDATLVSHHLALLNALFATIQLLLGIGIAWRPAARVALAASVAWSAGVWWFGEGFGMVLTGSASPFDAPGAVILYALLAVLLWPGERGPARVAAPSAAAPSVAVPSAAVPFVAGPFVAGRAVGAPVARALWLVLWLSLAYFALLPASRAPQALHDMMAGMAGGEPGWLAALERGGAALVAHQGLAASVALAVAFAVIAAGVYLPVPAARGTLILALVVTAVIWVFGQALGEIMTGGATDPNSGPLLALLALAYWPARAAGPVAAADGGNAAS